MKDQRVLSGLTPVYILVNSHPGWVLCWYDGKMIHITWHILAITDFHETEKKKKNINTRQINKRVPVPTTTWRMSCRNDHIPTKLHKNQPGIANVKYQLFKRLYTRIINWSIWTIHQFPVDQLLPPLQVMISPFQISSHLNIVWWFIIRYGYY